MKLLHTHMQRFRGIKITHSSLPGIFIVYLGFMDAVYTFNENSQLNHNVVKAPKLTSHKKAANIKKWFKEYMLPTVSAAPHIGTTLSPNFTCCAHHF